MIPLCPISCELHHQEQLPCMIGRMHGSTFQGDLSCPDLHTSCVCKVVAHSWLVQIRLFPMPSPWVFRLPGDDFEWEEEECGLPLDRAILALSTDTQQPPHPTHNCPQANLRGAMNGLAIIQGPAAPKSITKRRAQIKSSGALESKASLQTKVALEAYSYCPY